MTSSMAAFRPLQRYRIACPGGAIRVETELTLEEIHRQINHGTKSFLLRWLDAKGEALPLIVVVSGIISIEQELEE